ncbi:sugar phosphate nucleotidyltransferase [Paenibacillus validus]|uniref:sugar phosphate nucleotidyltransferase n=1 Tax=Paenibacillus TaxID=44249 RepID=UPI000FDA7667|nr:MULTISPECIES: sugar phosphate nucleotidyltransferase [Paenibacillus]MED4601682.1 sugar phosphate nucleotidyltransferase [Paenibacillus validus]MED4606207.1 sugar phosphate nucleotidyltransferase [Paenibacillus validus]
MKFILLSGGSGKRLWPLSNDIRSKQFLKVLRDDQGNLESMVDRVWRQMGNSGITNSAYIATGQSQKEIMQSQVGELVPLIIEPERRDTFPAIALAAVYLYSVESIGLDETVVILPVDPYVEDAFFEKIKDLETVLEQSGSDLALMGVKPTFPSEKYGYIVPDVCRTGNEDALYTKVGSFHEKPSQAAAAELIKRSALWNCGIFAFKLDFIINLLIQKGVPLQYEELKKQYGKLEKISFDYEVVEKTTHISMMPYDGVWKDLGTWNTLTEEMSTSILGQGILTDDCQDTHIINELNIPVTVLDLSDVIVAASPDGILVASKSSTPKIKNIIESINQPPMYEEKLWGNFKVLDYATDADGQRTLIRRVSISENRFLSYQLHRNHDEVMTVISGTGEMIIDEKIMKLQPGDTIRIPRGTRHSVHAITKIEYVEVQQGTDLEDTFELSKDWHEIIKLSTQ